MISLRLLTFLFRVDNFLESSFLRENNLSSTFSIHFEASLKKKGS